MTELLEERSAHFLIKHDSGNIELLPKSDLNVLLYKHDLFGFLRDGTDTLAFVDEDSRGYEGDIRITPEDDGFRVYWRDDEFLIGDHHRPVFVDALSEAFEHDDTSDRFEVMRDFLNDLLDVDVNRNYVMPFLELPALDGKVEARVDGWVIYGYVLVTYDNETYHLHSGNTRSVGGGVSTMGEKKEAWMLGVGNGSNPPPLSDEADTPEEEFLARVMWLLDHLPENP